MGYNILILLSFVNREEPVDQATSKTTLLLFLSISSFLRGEISINTHETSDSSHIFIPVESSDEINNSLIFWFSSYIKKDDKLRIKISTKSLEKPKMRR